jgi:hypothetical protein
VREPGRERGAACWADGVQALGPVARIPGRALTAELWGAEAPLWANPLLQLELPAALYTAMIVMRQALPSAWRRASPRSEQPDWLALRPLQLQPQAGERAAVVEIHFSCGLWWTRRGRGAGGGPDAGRRVGYAPRATDTLICAGLCGLEAAVPVLWQLPLLKARKEPIWRLWVSGFHKHAALGVPECPCVWRCSEKDGPEATAWRAHCFWGCPVAEAVVAVAAALPAPTPVVTRCQCGCCSPPRGAPSVAHHAAALWCAAPRPHGGG